MRTLLFLAGCLVIATPSDAAPVQWTLAAGGNGHYYEVVLDPTPWTEAKLLAEQSSLGGFTGHLATIGGQAENDFLTSLLPVIPPGFPNVFYIGGLRQPGGIDVSEGWEWITLEAFEYTNWSPVEPNGSPGTIRYLSIWADTSGSHVRGQWNDGEGGGNPAFALGYVIEYGPLPEPSAAALLLLAGAGWMRRFSALRRL